MTSPFPGPNAADVPPPPLHPNSLRLARLRSSLLNRPANASATASATAPTTAPTGVALAAGPANGSAPTAAAWPAPPPPGMPGMPGAQPALPPGGPMGAPAPHSPPAVDDLLARLAGLADRMPPAEVPDRAAFVRAARLLLKHGEPALRRLLDDEAPPQAFNQDALISLEAIIVADGSRPSFLLDGGRFAAAHPFMGAWAGILNPLADTLCQAAQAVGRIEPANGHDGFYIGTGTLVDRDKGLVLTNAHVLNQARLDYGIVMLGDDDRLDVVGDWFINFNAEAASTEPNLFRIVQARLPAGAGELFDGLDAAVLRIAPVDSRSQWPKQALPLRPLTQPPPGALGPGVVSIGFPSEPRADDVDSETGVDWAFVLGTLFGRRFGRKRLAPGLFCGGPGTDPRDLQRLAVAHDATTFGGSSGSVLMALQDGAAPGFALHFAGRTGRLNNALAFERAAEALAAAGLHFG